MVQPDFAFFLRFSRTFSGIFLCSWPQAIHRSRFVLAQLVVPLTYCRSGRPAHSLWLWRWEENGRTAGCITERDLNSKYKYYLCFAFFAYIFISPRCSDADSVVRRRRRMLSPEMNRTLIWTSAVRYSDTFLKYFYGLRNIIFFFVRCQCFG